VVIRYTRASARSTREVLAHLTRHGIPERLAVRVVAESKTRGLVDDRACARLWADHWARQGYAGSAIRLKLEAKQLDEQTIHDAMHRSDRAQPDEARAREVVASYLRRHRQPPARQRMGVARVLATRGFDPELIERVLTDAFGPVPSHVEP